jgi:beta-1,4-mannosyl-glycoprotein beta-1,4-N-acetylglucosaminyltransferase
MFFDCFTFYNELDILELRLQLLYDKVDYFVIVEGNKTFRGEEKPFYFKENEKRYFPFRDKIIAIQYECDIEGKGAKDWSIEIAQRNAILIGLAGKCQLDDIVIISDVDEIPDPQIFDMLNNGNIIFKPKAFDIRRGIKQYARLLSEINTEFFLKSLRDKKQITLEETLKYTPVTLEQKLFYYYMNCMSEEKWHATVISRYANMLTPEKMRLLSFDKQFPILRNSGWHFSYLGGVEKISRKLQSIIDGEDDIIEKYERYSSNPEALRLCVEQGEDIYERRKFHFIADNEIGLDNIKEIRKQYPAFFK